MVHIKKLNEMMGDRYYLYKGYHEAYISDRLVAGTTNNRPSEYRTFNDAYEAAEKLGVDILYSDGLRDEVCDFFGDRNYCDENPELFFNPDEPIRESRRANARGRAVNEMAGNAQRSVSYGELAELENMFNDQIKRKHIVFSDPEESSQALFDFIQQYIEGNDNPQVNVM